MAVYNNRQMNKMRQDAIRRSQEMYSRSAVNSSHYSEDSREDTAPPAENKSDKNKPSEKKQSGMQLNKFLEDFLGDSIDADKLLIAALIWLLIKEGADKKLIIALGYILF
ncbi:MAG: hypothetical protein NC485_12495 [Ruminococcus flavefaciens]|nr:hypothetical protein [Ruminococcus flavefaciens]MCM1061391.1 hypothetical protein [Eubacterium sp.]